MKIIGLMLARNEDWVIGLSARAALMWCDMLVVGVHSPDREDWTLATVSDLSMFHSVVFWSTTDPVFHEMHFRQMMLETARKHDATHIALIDADEVLTGDLLPKIRNYVEEVPGKILQLPWLQLAGDGGYMTSGLWSRESASVAFRDHPVYHWAARDGYDHHHRHPMGFPFEGHNPLCDRSSGLMHLQFLSRRRLVAKQFLYQLTERLRWPGRDTTAAIVERYAPTVWEADQAKVSPCPESWWAPYSHLMQYLHVDREPWQEAECRRLISEHPGIERGLEDFGLMKQWEEQEVSRGL